MDLLHDKEVTQVPYMEEKSLKFIYFCCLRHKCFFYVVEPYYFHVKVPLCPYSVWMVTLASRKEIEKEGKRREEASSWSYIHI